MNHKVLKTIEKYNMLSLGNSVVVGVSGGADSVCLFDILLKLKDDFRLKLYVCHINHNLRGEESLADEMFVRELCEKSGVECFVLSVNVKELAENKGISIEECGREVRYNFFSEKAKLYNAKIATAHTLSDSLETFFINFFRGSGTKGLCGIPPIRDNIIRPITQLTRQEIEDYCTENSLKYVTDKSNFSDIYLRNNIRHKIIPELMEISPSLYKTFSRNSEIISNEDLFLDKLAKDKFLELKSEKGFDIKALDKIDRVLQRRIIKIITDEFNCTDNRKIELICDMIKNKSGCLQLSIDVFISVKDGYISINIKEKKRNYFEFLVESGKHLIYNEKNVEFTILETKDNYKEVFKNVTFNVFDYDKIIGTAKIRQKKDGDYIKLNRSPHRKKLKKLFNEAKVPLEKRKELCVICDDMGVIWVEGFGFDVRVKPDIDTKKLLYIDI